jgi:hypothetical protein
MATEGIVVVDNQGAERTYPTGQTWESDGFGDVIVKDSTGNNIAMHKRGDVRLVYIRQPEQ